MCFETAKFAYCVMLNHSILFHANEKKDAIFDTDIAILLI